MGRLISDRMSYRNHYMCSGEATSTYYFITNVKMIFLAFQKNMCSIGSVISEKLLNKLTEKQTFYSFDTKSKTISSMVRPFQLNY